MSTTSHGKRPGARHYFGLSGLTSRSGWGVDGGCLQTPNLILRHPHRLSVVLSTDKITPLTVQVGVTPIAPQASGPQAER